MKTRHTLALSVLLACSIAFSATAVAQPVMPDLGHPWSPEELVAAEEAALATKPLLNVSTRVGKGFFEHVMAPDYFKTLAAGRSSVPARVHLCATMLDSSRRLVDAYADAADHGQPLHEELADLIVLQLNYATLYSILATDWFSATNPKDPRVVSARAQMDQSFGAMYTGALKVTVHPQFFTAPEVHYILRRASGTIGSFKTYFTAPTRAALRQQLATQRPLYSNDADRQEVDKMLQALAG